MKPQSGTPESERSAAHRRGRLYEELLSLIAVHGLEDVRWMLGVVADDIAEETAGATTKAR